MRMLDLPPRILLQKGCRHEGQGQKERRKTKEEVPDFLIVPRYNFKTTWATRTTSRQRKTKINPSNGSALVADTAEPEGCREYMEACSVFTGVS
jgi:hypothetical protein